MVVGLKVYKVKTMASYMCTKAEIGKIIGCSESGTEAQMWLPGRRLDYISHSLG